MLRRLKLVSPAFPEAAAAVARWEDDLSRLATKPAATAKPDPAEATYLEKVREHIRPRWIYPREASEKGIGGEGVAHVAIRRDGHVHVAGITRSTGVPVLDKAMLDAIQVAQPLPVVPDAISQDPYELDLEFRYQIVERTSSRQQPAARFPDPPGVCR